MNEVCGHADANVLGRVPVEAAAATVKHRRIALRPAGNQSGDDSSLNRVRWSGTHALVKYSECGPNEERDRFELSNVELWACAVGGRLCLERNTQNVARRKNEMG